MAFTGITSSPTGNAFKQIIEADDIEPGSAPSYQLCKEIYLWHPLAGKLADKPIRLAQSQPRTISVGVGPSDLLVKQFLDTERRLGIKRAVRNTMRISRIYGISTLALKQKGEEPSVPLDPWSLKAENVIFSVFDPLNTAGSMVTNLDPNAEGFQAPQAVRVAGQMYDMSRTFVQMHEEPIYLGWTASAYGYVGRSIYQRVLYPLKSFLTTMRTDDLVVRKVGVLVAKLHGENGVVDNFGVFKALFKRNVVKEAETDNVISISVDEEIESLNLQNLDAPMELARANILKNIAVGTDVHAKILEDETFVSGFGEGTEDARNIAACIDGIREDMEALYGWVDDIVMHCAWTEEFYETIKAQFEEYADLDYKAAFYEWKNSFQAVWPDLLKEPESEEVKVREVKFRTAAAVVEILGPSLDPENKADLIEWFVDAISEDKLLFPAPIELDFEKILEWLQERQERDDSAADAAQEDPMDKEVKPPRPFADALGAAVARLPDRSKVKRHGQAG